MLSKLLERNMYKKLGKFLTVNSVLIEYRYGFRRGLWIVNALLDLSKRVYDELKEGNYLLSFYIDFSNAFDTELWDFTQQYVKVCDSYVERVMLDSVITCEQGSNVWELVLLPVAVV